MMKKIFLLVIGFVMFKMGYSQYPIQQYIGADSAVVTSKGGLQGRLINQVFVDTTAANSQRIRQYPGAMIYASGKLWLRNSTATGWNELAQGPISTTNIYNSDGTLTGNRTVDGGGYTLFFNTLSKFSTESDTLDFNLQGANPRIFINGLSSTIDTTYKPLVLGTGNRVLQMSSWPTSGYVPYVGANQNVDLGQYGLKTEYVEFDTTLRAVTDRTLSWNNDDGTLNLGMVNGGSLTQKIGLQQFARVKNVDTVAISKGQAVYIFGASGDRASVKLAVNKGDATSSKTLGVAAENIPINGVGFVGTFGTISNLNLGAYTAGNILYLDSIPGQLTATKPQAPYHIVFVGVVERANAGNGLLFVNPQNGYELDELHNVRITSPVPNKAILMYDSTRALWVDTTIAASGVAVTSVATNTGTGITGGTITTTGTLAIDTNLISTRLWRQKGIDSVTSLINARPSGSGTTNYLSKWTSSSALGNSLVYDNGTSVGVNTATPSASYKLDVSGNAQIVNPLSTTTLKLGGGGIYTGTIDFGNSYISQTSSPILTIQSNGTLDLSTNFATRLRITSSGRVLIGTTTESTYELDVVGDIRSTLDANINGLTVGKGGGQILTNTAIGYEAILNSTTGAINNIAQGYQALRTNTTGNNNSALGYVALYTNSVGIRNTAVGSFALQGLNSDNNTGVGFQNLLDVTSGQGNTAIGSNTGRGITTGSYNTIIGASVTGLSSSLSNAVILADGQGNQRIVVNSSNQIGLGGQPVAPFPVHITAVSGYGLGVRNATTSTKQTQINDGSIVLGDGSGNYATIENLGTSGTLTYTSAIHWFRVGSTTSMYLPNNGNVLIGTTTDAGYKLDVNGTAIVRAATGNADFSFSSGGKFRISNNNFASTHFEYNASTGATSMYIFSTNNNNIRSDGSGILYFLTGQDLRLQSGAFASSNAQAFTIKRNDPNATNAVGLELNDGGATPHSNFKPFVVKVNSVEKTHFDQYGGGHFGTSTSETSAILSATSTTKGFLPPRMTGAQAEAIATPAAGLMVYANNGNGTTITSTGWWGYDGTNWVKLN